MAADVATVDDTLTVDWQAGWNRVAPPRYRGAQIGPGPVLDTARAILTDTGTALMLTGPCGSGKTHAAWAVARQLVASGAIAASDVLAGGEADVLAACVTGPWASRDAAWSRLRGPWRLAVIDDVGWGMWPAAGDQQALWHDLCDRAWRNRARIITTSNHDPDGLAEWIGPAAWDRLASMSGGVVCRLAGHSRRAAR